jgi:hypothetical protein
VPAIVNDPGILRAARNAVVLMLKFKGNPIVLRRRGTIVNKPSGGKDFTGRVDIPAQTLALAQIGGDVIEDTEGGAQSVQRNYILTGRYDADIQVGDIWKTVEAEFEVKSVNDDNSYKVTAEVVGTVRSPDSTVGGDSFLQFSAGQ